MTQCQKVLVCGECVPIPKVTGADLKDYRQECLHMNVNEFAARFGVSRQRVAHFERLTRPLTHDEIMSIDLTKPVRDGRVRLMLKSVTKAR